MFRPRNSHAVRRRSLVPAARRFERSSPLQRSVEALSAAAVQALRVLGDAATQRVESRIALAQDCLLIDEYQAHVRPDLMTTGRALFGSEPLLGANRDRVDACTLATEHELERLGVRVRTSERYGRYVIAPCCADPGTAEEEMQVAVSILRVQAQRYGLACVAGEELSSAWSLATDRGENPLAPGSRPSEHLRFLFFGAAVLKAVDRHRGLLIATAGVPASISLQLGRELERVYRAIARGEAAPLRLPVGKFELSGLSGALGCTVLNTIVADALGEMTRAVRAWTGAGDDLEPAVREVIADAYRCHHRVVFAGGALDVDSPDSLRELIADPTVRVFAKHGVLSAAELRVCHDTLVERYAVRLDIEARVAAQMARTQIGPVAERTRPVTAGAAFERALRELYDAAERLEDAVSHAADEGLERARDLRHDVPPLLNEIRHAAARLERAQRGGSVSCVA